MSESKSVNIALVGGGIFAKSSHVPAWIGLNKRKDLAPVRIVAVYSRSKRSVTELAQAVVQMQRQVLPDSKEKDSAPDAYCDEDEQAGYAQLLRRPDVDGVVIVLAADVQPKFVLAALAAGKHVMVEKPLAGDAKAATELWKTYATEYRSKGQLFCLAENYRVEPAFLLARQLAARLGKLLLAQLTVHAPMDSKNPYYHTAWRKNPAHLGSYLLDGGVHFVAALRLVVGSEADKVVGLSTQLSEELPPPDTLAGSIRFKNGVLASVQISFATTSRAFVLTVTGAKGSVSVERGVRDNKHGYTVSSLISGESSSSFFPFGGAENEAAGFIHGIRPVKEQDTAQLDEYLALVSAEHGIADIEIVHGLL